MGTGDFGHEDAGFPDIPRNHLSYSIYTVEGLARAGSLFDREDFIMRITGKLCQGYAWSGEINVFRES